MQPSTKGSTNESSGAKTHKQSVDPTVNLSVHQLQSVNQAVSHACTHQSENQALSQTMPKHTSSPLDPTVSSYLFINCNQSINLSIIQSSRFNPVRSTLRNVMGCSYVQPRCTLRTPWLDEYIKQCIKVRERNHELPLYRLHGGAC